ncbi:MAG: OmpA family protein [Deltaproteobacteria bacterium]|nr:OmpA family protein [Deltaproteobacteria bacterium]
MAACHHAKKPTTMPLPTPVAPAPTTEAKATPPQPVSTNLTAGSDLVEKCALQVSHETPQFDFNKFELTAQDRSVLEQVATCLTTGPLKGKQLELVGRADPRGTEEYNMGLGDRRAHTVSEYLEHLGVSHVEAKTRGALDATGTDESGWAHDRRVDMQVN